VRKVVVSRQRPEFSWRNSELIKGDLLGAVTSLRADAGIRGILIPARSAWCGSLLAAGLVDELRLLVHPVAARGAAGCSTTATRLHLTVTAAEAFPTALIRVIYAPAGATRQGRLRRGQTRHPAGNSRPPGRITATAPHPPAGDCGFESASRRPVAAIRAEARTTSSERRTPPGRNPAVFGPFS